MLAEALVLLFIVLGAGSWWAEYRAQKAAGQRLLVVRPPWWVAWLCGRPQGDGTIELDHAAKQLAAVALALGAPLAYLVTGEPHLLAGLVFSAYALVALPAFALVAWASRREEREGHRACGPRRAG
jgi:hypothetical protein